MKTSNKLLLGLLLSVLLFATVVIVVVKVNLKEGPGNQGAQVEAPTAPAAPQTPR